MIPDERGVRLKAVQAVVEVGRIPLRKGRIQSLPFHYIGQLQRNAVFVAIVLVLGVETDVEEIVRSKSADKSGHDLPVYAECADLPIIIAPVRLHRQTPIGRDSAQAIADRLAERL